MHRVPCLKVKDDAQPLEDFHSKIMGKGYRLQKPERDLITKLFNELPQQLAFFVRTALVKSFKDALQHAKLGEAYGDRTITTPRTPTVAAVKDKMKNKMSKFSICCVQLRIGSTSLNLPLPDLPT